MMLNEKQEKSLDAFRSFVGNESFTRKDISRFTDETKTHKELGVIRPWFLVDVCEKIDRENIVFLLLMVHQLKLLMNLLWFLLQPILILQ